MENIVKKKLKDDSVKVDPSSWDVEAIMAHNTADLAVEEQRDAEDLRVKITGTTDGSTLTREGLQTFIEKVAFKMRQLMIERRATIIKNASVTPRYHPMGEEDFDGETFLGSVEIEATCVFVGCH